MMIFVGPYFEDSNQSG